MSMNETNIDYRDPEWVAEKLGVDKNTVYKRLQDGTIPALQLGRKWLISEAEFGTWLRAEADRQTLARREACSSADRTTRRMAKYAADAREVIREAHAEARRYCHGYLGQEHLLLGIAGQPGCGAGQTLEALGVGCDARAARGRVSRGGRKLDASTPPGPHAACSKGDAFGRPPGRRAGLRRAPPRALASRPPRDGRGRRL